MLRRGGGERGNQGPVNPYTGPADRSDEKKRGGKRRHDHFFGRGGEKGLPPPLDCRLGKGKRYPLHSLLLERDGGEKKRDELRPPSPLFCTVVLKRERRKRNGKKQLLSSEIPLLTARHRHEEKKKKGTSDVLPISPGIWEKDQGEIERKDITFFPRPTVPRKKEEKKKKMAVQFRASPPSAGWGRGGGKGASHSGYRDVGKKRGKVHSAPTVCSPPSRCTPPRRERRGTTRSRSQTEEGSTTVRGQPVKRQKREKKKGGLIIPLLWVTLEKKRGEGRPDGFSPTSLP